MVYYGTITVPLAGERVYPNPSDLSLSLQEEDSYAPEARVGKGAERFLCGFLVARLFSCAASPVPFPLNTIRIERTGNGV